MQRSFCAYLHDILEAADAIQVFTAGLDFDTFNSVDLVRSAVERKFEIIGEALRQASLYFPGSVDSVPDLRDAIGQRNRIAHGYFDLDAKLLWHTLQNDLEPLVKEVKRLKAIGCP